MKVEVRIYRRHDADLIMLKSYGINISKMMRLALDNYVEGERIKFRLPDSHACDITDCSMLRYRLNITNPKVVKLLKSIKRGYRNQFCKQLLRDMMDSIALGVYINENEGIEFENKRIKSEAMIANTDLGIIKKRENLTSEAVFSQIKRVSEEKEKKVIDINNKRAEKDELLLAKEIEERLSVPKNDTKNEKNRNANLFSMFEDLVVQA